MRAVINVIIIIASFALIVLGVHGGCEAAKEALRQHLALSADAQEQHQPAPVHPLPGQVWEKRFSVGNPWGERVRLWTVVAVSNGWVRYRTESGHVDAIPMGAFLMHAKMVLDGAEVTQ